MITATVYDALGNLVYTIKFDGFEAFLGSVMGVLIALIAWVILSKTRMS